MARRPPLPKFGAHMSITGGFDKAIDRGEDCGCDTVQIFTKSNRQWKAAPLEGADIDTFLERKDKTRITPIFAHAAYLINLCSESVPTRRQSVKAMIDELQRAARLELPFVVLHPGSHGSQGAKRGLRLAADNLRRVFDGTSDCAVRIALETTAGQGTALGARFEDLADLHERIDAEERLCVCLDSCHIFAAGYELRDEKSYKATIKEFDRVVGLHRLHAIHLNDSKKPFAEHKDRHEHIGQGQIGCDGFRFIVNDRRLRKIPMVLETPKGDDNADDKMNLKTLRGLVKR